MVYRPTARVLTVLELLQAHGRMTGAQLARRLEVDIRTVRNYVQTLQDMGIPVEAERGRYGAYRLRPSYKLPPLIFSEDESLALTLALLVARQSELATMVPAFAGVQAKVERVLPQETRLRIQAVEQTVALENLPPRAPLSGPTILLLSSAIQRGRRVLLHYRSARQDITERAFDPYGIAHHKGFWYTIGYCHLRRGQRLFRVDRIVKIEMSNETFSPQPNFPALAAVQQALALVPRAWQVEVWLETTLAEAQRQTRFPRAFFTEDEGGVLLRMDVEDLPWMVQALAGLDFPFVIKQPPELCAVLSQHAQALLDYARRSERVGTSNSAVQQKEGSEPEL